MVMLTNLQKVDHNGAGGAGKDHVVNDRRGERSGHSQKKERHQVQEKTYENQGEEEEELLVEEKTAQGQ